MKVIGISGQKRQGKDVAANHLVKRLHIPTTYSKTEFDFFGDPIRTPPNRWKRTAFADNLKEILEKTFGISQKFIEEWKVKEDTPEELDMPVRDALKLIGETFREIKGSVWIDLVYRQGNNIVISDVRYINELESVRNNQGSNILLLRPGYENDDPHDSEAQLKELVDWYDKTGMEGCVFKDLLEKHKTEENIISIFPANIELLGKIKLVDFFIRNDGNLEDLYEKLDKFVVSEFKA